MVEGGGSCCGSSCGQGVLGGHMIVAVLDERSVTQIHLHPFLKKRRTQLPVSAERSKQPSIV